MKIIALLMMTFLATTVSADSFWDHNGSTMRLVANGQQRFFYYEDPRQGMRDVGVQTGTLLFDGQRIGNRYIGTARVFSSRCALPMTYPMNGDVVSETYVVLEGWRPNFSNCVPDGTSRWERLEFRYISDTLPRPSIGKGNLISGNDFARAFQLLSASERYALQDTLYRLGYYQGRIDATWGRMTERAVLMAFQDMGNNYAKLYDRGALAAAEFYGFLFSADFFE